MERDLNSSFLEAKDRYASIGVNVEKAIEQASKVSISIHAWQGGCFGRSGPGASGDLHNRIYFLL